MKIKTILKILALVLIAVFFFSYRNDFKVALSILQNQLTLKLTAAIMVFTLLHFGNEPMRLWLILKKVHFNVPLGRIYHTITAIALISYIFPVHAGFPARLAMAKKILTLDYVKASAILVIDSLVIYGAWASVAIVGVIMLLPSWKSPIIMTVSGVAIIGLIGFALLVHYAPDHLACFPWLLKYVQRFSGALRSVSRNVVILNSLLVISDIFFYGVRHALILAALGTQLSLLKVTLIVAISIVAGFVSLMPFGLGGYDISLIFLFTLFDVPHEVAVAVPIINRAFMLFLVFILGGTSVLHLGITPKGIKGDGNDA